MKLLWSGRAWDQYVGWQAEDAAIVRRINLLIGECRRTPFTGTGKPEPLRRELKGCWSRRVTAEHRLVYQVAGVAGEQRLEIIQCRFHY